MRLAPARRSLRQAIAESAPQAVGAEARATAEADHSDMSRHDLAKGMDDDTFVCDTRDLTLSPQPGEHTRHRIVEGRRRTQQAWPVSRNTNHQRIAVKLLQIARAHTNIHHTPHILSSSRQHHRAARHEKYAYGSLTLASPPEDSPRPSGRGEAASPSNQEQHDKIPNPARPSPHAKWTSAHLRTVRRHCSAALRPQGVAVEVYRL